MVFSFQGRAISLVEGICVVFKCWFGEEEGIDSVGSLRQYNQGERRE